MKKIAIIGLVGLALITTNCKSKKTETTTNQEQKRGQQGQDPFAEMDKNNDGLLTKTEAKGPIANDFAKIDLDGDGIITRAEFDKAPKPQRGGGDRPARR
mgnify:CR=1 FL=1